MNYSKRDIMANQGIGLIYSYPDLQYHYEIILYLRNDQIFILSLPVKGC